MINLEDEEVREKMTRKEDYAVTIWNNFDFTNNTVDIGELVVTHLVETYSQDTLQKLAEEARAGLNEPSFIFHPKSYEMVLKKQAAKRKCRGSADYAACIAREGG